MYTILFSSQRRKRKFKSAKVGTDKHTASEVCVQQMRPCCPVPGPVLWALIRGALPAQQSALATVSEGCPRGQSSLSRGSGEQSAWSYSLPRSPPLEWECEGGSDSP